MKLLVPDAAKDMESQGEGEGARVDLEGTIESITRAESGATVLLVNGQEVVLPPGSQIGNALKEGMTIELETTAQPDGAFSVTELEAESEDGIKVELKGEDPEIEEGTIESATETESGAMVVVVTGQEVVLGPDTEVEGFLAVGA